MMKKLFAALLSVCMMLALASCATEEVEVKEEGEAGVAVQVVDVASDTIFTENITVGQLSSEDEVNVLSLSSVKCLAVYKNTGDTVEKGEKIATLAMDGTIANYNAAKIGYNSAMQSYNDQKEILTRQVKLAEDNVANTKALFEIGAASQLEVDQAELSYQSAVAGMNSALSQLESGIQSAKSGVEQLETVLEYMDSKGNLIAPTSGTLAALNAVEGSYTPSAGILATVVGSGKMKITTQVSEALVSRINSGDEASVYVSSADQTFTAAIKSVDRAANYQTRLYTVTLSIPEETEGLLSGMSAEVTFHTDVSENTISIPTEAILTGTDGQHVFVVEDGIAHRRIITTGLTGSGVTEVLTGLAVGEDLVTVGQAYLVEGSAVRVVGGGK